MTHRIRNNESHICRVPRRHGPVPHPVHRGQLQEATFQWIYLRQERNCWSVLPQTNFNVIIPAHPPTAEYQVGLFIITPLPMIFCQPIIGHCPLPLEFRRTNLVRLSNKSIHRRPFQFLFKLKVTNEQADHILICDNGKVADALPAFQKVHKFLSKLCCKGISICITKLSEGPKSCSSILFFNLFSTSFVSEYDSTGKALSALCEIASETCTAWYQTLEK